MKVLERCCEGAGLLLLHQEDVVCEGFGRCSMPERRETNSKVERSLTPGRMALVVKSERKP
jgi:hypothetical protein